MFGPLKIEEFKIVLNMKLKAPNKKLSNESF